MSKIYFSFNIILFNNYFQLLDMKLTNHLSPSYGGVDGEMGTKVILQQYTGGSMTPSPPSSVKMSQYAPVSVTPPFPPCSPDYDKKPLDIHRSCKSSQELYNPTYEEISSGESSFNQYSGNNHKICTILL